MRGTHKLTALAVKNVGTPGLYGDGLGLYLQVSGFGTKSWLFRFMRDGRARKMGLGPLHTVTLADARLRAADARKALLDGHDPIEARAAKRAARKVESAKTLTFNSAADKYLAANEAGWRSEVHRKQWSATLATYVYPVFGDIGVGNIDTPLVLKVLEPIWNTKPETANRVRGRIETVLNWAIAREYRSGPNPAAWRGRLDNVLPARSKVKAVQHHAAVPYAELPALMSNLRKSASASSLALQFTILTAARTSETIGATWSEINSEACTWTVPGERMKGGRQHRVPLSDLTLALLHNLPRVSEHLFPGARAGKSLSNMAMLELLRGLQPGQTVHGMRSAFRDWAAETTQHPNHVVEMALAHAVGDKVEAAYRRGDLFEKRRQLMTDWAKFLCGTP